MIKHSILNVQHYKNLPLSLPFFPFSAIYLMDETLAPTFVVLIH